MKRFLMIIALLFLSTNSLPAKQAAVSSARVKPNTAVQQWQVLKTRGIKTVRLSPVASGKQLKVHMAGIRTALERANVRETVSVLLYVDGKRKANLGRYIPGHKSGKADFSQMPTVKKIPHNITKTGNAELVFLNAGGAVVARVPTKIVQSKTVWKNNTAIPR